MILWTCVGTDEESDTTNDDVEDVIQYIIMLEGKISIYYKVC